MPAASSSALPSLLRNLTSSARTSSSASVSLDSPSSSTLLASHNDDQPSTASQSSNSTHGHRGQGRRLHRGTRGRDAPTSHSSTIEPLRSSDQNRIAAAGDSESVASRSRASSDSDSSLEGLTARLRGARQGRRSRSGPTETAQAASDGVNDAQAEPAPALDPHLASVPTIALSPDQVENEHGAAHLVALDPNEPPPPLTVPSPALSIATADSSVFEPPSDETKITIERDDDDPGHASTQARTTFTQSISDTDSSPSLDDDDKDNDTDAESAESRSVNFVARSDAQPDPRDLLRSQLARAEIETNARPSRNNSQAEHVREASGREYNFEARTKLDRKVSATSTKTVASVAQSQRQEFTYDKRRYFILSTAGKLVYTSDHDEDMASGLVGVMQAIVSIFADEGDKIRTVDTGNRRITFLLKSPLYLVVSSSWGEPESTLRTHLDYLYLQVLSVVTHTQLQAIFARRSNFDLRRMMEGTESFFHSLVKSLQTSIPMLTSSIEVYRLDPNVRNEISKVLDPGREVTKKLDLLYVLLLARGRLVTLLRPRKHSIHPTDLHLLLSTIYSTSPRKAKPAAINEGTDMKNGSVDSDDEDDNRTSPLTEPGLESWLPICLPRFNPKGFLHAYVSFLPSNGSSNSAKQGPTPSSGGGNEGAGIVLLSSDRDAFAGVKQVAESIKDKLQGLSPLQTDHEEKGKGSRKTGKAGGHLIHELEKARVLQEYSLVELAIPGVRHFVYKSRTLVQSTRPAWEGDYLPLQARYRLVTLYQHLSDTLHPRPAQTGTVARKPAQVQFYRTEHEAVLGWSTAEFELYVATSALLPHSAVVAAAKRVSKWVEKEESRLFLMTSPSF
ncbi:guanine nucleotide exchange factor MON1 [Sporobolomyces koalae]|uniref:guanine nucleotide exchange factor MON1 n=1 Tax=Sporobolomyces koalae TaxID=500713 RepID=UPI00316B3428